MDFPFADDNTSNAQQQSEQRAGNKPTRSFGIRDVWEVIHISTTLARSIVVDLTGIKAHISGEELTCEVQEQNCRRKNNESYA